MSPGKNKKKYHDHKNALGDYFSTQTDVWRKYYELDDFSQISLLQLEVIKRKQTVLELLDKHTGKESLNMLDIGCGAGILMKDLLQRGHSVVGSDISEKMIKEAKKNTADFPAERKRFIKGDLENLSFNAETFDFVTCVGVLEYQTNDNKSISEISRVLTSNGYVIITIPNLYRFRNFLDPYYYVKILPRWFRKIYRKAKPGPIDPVEAFGFNKFFTNKKYYYGQLNNLFSAFNLEILEYVSIGYSPLLTFWQKRIISKSASIKLDRFLENKSSRGLSLLHWIPNRWVICLKKTQP